MRLRDDLVVDVLDMMSKALDDEILNHCLTGFYNKETKDKLEVCDLIDMVKTFEDIRENKIMEICKILGVDNLNDKTIVINPHNPIGKELVEMFNSLDLESLGSKVISWVMCPEDRILCVNRESYEYIPKT